MLMTQLEMGLQVKCWLRDAYLWGKWKRKKMKQEAEERMGFSREPGARNTQGERDKQNKKNKQSTKQPGGSLRN